MTAIARYLDSLDEELRAPRRARARILAEVRDHLEESLAVRVAEGTRADEAERASVDAFGDPVELAQSFHEELARAGASRASSRTAALLGAFVVAGLAAGGGRLNHFPAGVVIFIAAQVAAVSGAIGIASWLRYRGEGGLPLERLRDAYRANALTAACVAIAALAEGSDALTHSSTRPAAYAIGSGAILAGALWAGAHVARAASRARVLAPPAGAPDELALDDLLTVARMALAAAERRLPALAAAASRLPDAVAAARDRAPKLARWLELRRSPWRVCAIFAVACGLALAVAHGITDGGGPLTLANAGRALLAGIVLLGIEGAAVVVSFAAFGRLLGIRH